MRIVGSGAIIAAGSNANSQLINNGGKYKNLHYGEIAISGAAGGASSLVGLGVGGALAPSIASTIGSSSGSVFASTATGVLAGSAGGAISGGATDAIGQGILITSGYQDSYNIDQAKNSVIIGAAFGGIGVGVLKPL